VVVPVKKEEINFTDSSKYSTFRWQVISNQNEHLVSEN